MQYFKINVKQNLSIKKLCIMYRSENMSLNQIIFAKQSLWETLNFMAYQNQFMIAKPKAITQANSSIYDFSIKKTQQCNETMRYITEIEQTLNQFKWIPIDYKNTFTYYYKQIDYYCQSNQIEGEHFFETIANQVRQKNRFLNEIIQNYQEIVDQRKFLFDQKSAMFLLYPLGEKNSYVKGNTFSQLPKLFQNGPQNVNSNIKMFLGTINDQYVHKIRKTIFRISKENVFFNVQKLPHIEDYLIKKNSKDNTEDFQYKSLISIIIPDSHKETIFKQIKLLLQNFEFVSLKFLLGQSQDQMQQEIQISIDDNKNILQKTYHQIDQVLQDFISSKIITSISYIKTLKLICLRELNFAKNYQYIQEKKGFYQINVWIPQNQLDDINNDVQNIRLSDSTFIPPKIIQVQNSKSLISHNYFEVPSKFSTSDFMWGFQEIINTYGVPKYKEVNPALFTVITFPFQFAIMFGDIGHGFLMFFFGILCHLLGTTYPLLRKIKFMIILMGMFSIYCGFIYNEFFATPFVIFKTCYDEFTYQRRGHCVYPLGLDWIWASSENETTFINSFKMKFSVIVGVLHMLLGLILKGLNAIQFNKKLDLFFEAIPQFIFLFSTFGYMCICIIIKWTIDWTGKESQAVSIISLFINFTNVEQPLFGEGTNIQQNLHYAILVISILCIVLILVPKPFFIYFQDKKNLLPNTSQENIEENELNSEFDQIENYHQDEHKEHAFSEIVIHQLIETIEFVLGSISNTASYLRLWALSLAHSQLASVFYNMILGWAIEDAKHYFLNFLIVTICFVFYLIVTFAVIMVMDSMECFLHALRLHWVEFQNKFFEGEGVLFQSFNHEQNQQFEE